jgi:hypothetical protein
VGETDETAERLVHVDETPVVEGVDGDADRARVKDRRETFLRTRDLFLGAASIAPGARRADFPLDRGSEAVKVVFAHDVVGPRLDRRDGLIGADRSRDEEERGLRVALPQDRERSRAAEARHVAIPDDRVPGAGGQGRTEGALAVDAERQDVVPRSLEQVDDARGIVLRLPHDQNAPEGHVMTSRSSGRRARRRRRDLLGRFLASACRTRSAAFVPPPARTVASPAGREGLAS